MKRTCPGFTLIELLVVIAIIAMMTGILLPTLSKCKEMAKKITCQSNIKQIIVAWELYFVDNDNEIPRNGRMNQEFGGWKGMGGGSESRLLNSYLDLEPIITSENQRTVFYCPADSGGILGRPESQRAYNHFGNSYQANPFFVGSTLLPKNELYIALIQKYQQYDFLKLTDITVPHSKLLFFGDNNWPDQVDPDVPAGKDWHNKPGHFNMSFLDSHVEFISLPEDTYQNGNFTTIPFKDLFDLVNTD